jgi:hypothetical protein
MEDMNVLFGFLFFVAIIGATIWATSLAYDMGKNKKRKLKGKYIIIHYVYVGNAQLMPSKERVLQLQLSSSVLENEFGLDEEISDADSYLAYYKLRYSFKNKYDDVAEEIFIPVTSYTDKKFEILKPI